MDAPILLIHYPLYLRHLDLHRRTTPQGLLLDTWGVLPGTLGSVWSSKNAVILSAFITSEAVCILFRGLDCVFKILWRALHRIYNTLRNRCRLKSAGPPRLVNCKIFSLLDWILLLLGEGCHQPEEIWILYFCTHCLVQDLDVHS